MKKKKEKTVKIKQENAKTFIENNIRKKNGSWIKMEQKKRWGADFSIFHLSVYDTKALYWPSYCHIMSLHWGREGGSGSGSSRGRGVGGWNTPGRSSGSDSCCGSCCGSKVYTSVDITVDKGRMDIKIHHVCTGSVLISVRVRHRKGFSAN